MGLQANPGVCDSLMRVMALQTVKRAGSNETVLEKGQVYEAWQATNQPNFKRKGLYFVGTRESNILCTMHEEIEEA
jgi:hypothetical protein